MGLFTIIIVQRSQLTSSQVFLSNGAPKLPYGRNGRLPPWLVLTIRQIDWAVYDLVHKTLIRKTEYQPLNLIEAEPDTSTAFVDKIEIEEASDECVKAWQRAHLMIPIDTITRECALLLLLASTVDKVAQILIPTPPVDPSTR